MRTVVDIPDGIRAHTMGHNRGGGMPLRTVVEEERGLAQCVHDCSHDPLESVCGVDGFRTLATWAESLTLSSELKARDSLA